MSWRATAYVKGLRVSAKGKLITRGEKLVLFVLADYHHEEHGYAEVSLSRLADESLYDRRQIIRITQMAENNGFLRIEKGSGGEKNRYYILGRNSQQGPPKKEEPGDKMSPPVGDIAPPNGDIVPPGGSDIPTSKMSPTIRKQVLTSNKNTLPAATAADPGLPDPRQKAVTEILFREYMKNNNCQYQEVPFGPKQGKKLKKFLLDHRQWALAFIETCVTNRYRSQEINPAEPFETWFLTEKLTRYRNGPLDRFNRLLIPVESQAKTLSASERAKLQMQS